MYDKISESKRENQVYTQNKYKLKIIWEPCVALE